MMMDRTWYEIHNQTHTIIPSRPKRISYPGEGLNRIPDSIARDAIRKSLLCRLAIFYAKQEISILPALQTVQFWFARTSTVAKRKEDEAYFLLSTRADMLDWNGQQRTPDPKNFKHLQVKPIKNDSSRLCCSNVPNTSQTWPFFHASGVWDGAPCWQWP